MQLLNYGVEDWFDRPSRNGIELANSFGQYQSNNDYYSTTIPPTNRQLNYGVKDWFKRPPRYGINMSKSFAPRETPQTYFTPSPYPLVDGEPVSKKEIKKILAPPPNRMVL